MFPEMNHGRVRAPPIFVAGMTIRMILRSAQCLVITGSRYLQPPPDRTRAAIALAAVAIVVFIGAILRLT
jgi:hypothetical protein